MESLTINQATDSHYAGSIYASGGAMIVKTGAGRLYLENYNGYTGGTTINAGAIVAGDNSALGSGTIKLNGGKLFTENGVTLTNNLNLTAGTLGGFGTFDAPAALEIGANIILAPGSIDLKAPGTLSFGSNGLVFASNGTYTWQLQSGTGGEGIGWDWLNVCGPINITATGPSNQFTLALVTLDASGNNGLAGDFNPVFPYSWLIASASGGISNFNPNQFSIDPSGFQNSLAGGTFSLSLGGENTELFLNFNPVPEPSVGALLAAGLGLLLIGRRRRRRG